MRTLILTAATCLLATPLLAAQVHYHPDGNPLPTHCADASGEIACPEDD